MRARIEFMRAALIKEKRGLTSPFAWRLKLGPVLKELPTSMVNGWSVSTSPHFFWNSLNSRIYILKISGSREKSQDEMNARVR